ncbi:hypothetical protein D1007_55729 [Hordeum vulgare]|nr:hypothetical protein D1007_55729 [Hordeum vulgare]
MAATHHHSQGHCTARPGHISYPADQRSRARLPLPTTRAECPARSGHGAPDPPPPPWVGEITPDPATADSGRRRQSPRADARGPPPPSTGARAASPASPPAAAKREWGRRGGPMTARVSRFCSFCRRDAGQLTVFPIPPICKIMAESLLLPLVRGVAGKAADALVETVTRMCGLEDDRQTLERHLLAVECKLANAEEMSEKNSYVKRWMKELKSVAYQADDVLDDFQYEALRRQSKIGKSTTRKALSYITRHSPLLFRFEMSRKLKNVLKKINKLVEEMNKFGLENSVNREEQQHPCRQTHSKLDDTTQVFGRDNDKEVVVKLMLDQQDQRRVQVSASLRALCCPSYSVVISKAINAKHLRYLDLSGSYIVRLPDSIWVLYNLQTLRLMDCRKLRQLPEDMARLRKLIHLYLSGCESLKSMSPNFGLLNNLHILTTFVVGTGDGLGIEQLKDLQNLSNRLEILNMDKIKSGENAKEANLSQKQNLKRMDNLTTLCNNLDVERGGCITKVFPRLKNMRLIELASLEMWAENSMGEPSCDNLVTFPMLAELEIKNCPKLASIPAIPVVSKLSIVGVHGTAVASVFMCIRLGSWPFLTCLTLGSLEDTHMLPLDAQQSQSQRPLEKLVSLTLDGPNSLIRSFGLSESQLMVWKCFRFVRNLKIYGCSNLVRWPTEELRCMDRLRVLCVRNCDNLEGNTSSSEEETLPLCLEDLTIDNCRSVVALPSNLGYLAKLRRLWVEDCRSLTT